MTVNMRGRVKGSHRALEMRVDVTSGSVDVGRRGMFDGSSCEELDHPAQPHAIPSCRKFEDSLMAVCFIILWFLKECKPLMEFVSQGTDLAGMSLKHEAADHAGGKHLG